MSDTERAALTPNLKIAYDLSKPNNGANTLLVRPEHARALNEFAQGDRLVRQEIEAYGYFDLLGDSNACDYGQAISVVDTNQRKELTERYGLPVWLIIENFSFGLEDLAYTRSNGNTTTCIYPFYDGENSLLILRGNEGTSTNLSELGNSYLGYGNITSERAAKLDFILINGETGTSPYKTPVPYSNYGNFGPTVTEEGDKCTTNEAVIAFKVNATGNIAIDLSGLDNPGTEVINLPFNDAIQLFEGSTALTTCPNNIMQTERVAVELPGSSDSDFSPDVSSIPAGPLRTPVSENGEPLEADLRDAEFGEALSDAFENASNGEVNCDTQCIQEGMQEGVLTAGNTIPVDLDDPKQADGYIDGMAAGTMAGAIILGTIIAYRKVRKYFSG